MTVTIRTVVVATALAMALSAGVALGSPATTTTTTDGQANETASVTVADQLTDGETITIDSATLPDGGFAVVHDQGGTPIGHTEYLAAGGHENLTVSLNRSVESAQVLVVTLYRNNGSETYDATADSVAYRTESGSDASDVSYVYLEEYSRGTATSTTTATDDETTSATDGATTTAGSEETTDETTSSGGSPGFTPIAALVALLAAALVGLRRN